MTAFVILVLSVLVPGQPPNVAAYPMPSRAVCERAAATFLAGEPDARVIRDPNHTRSVACLDVPAQGRDA